MPGYDNHIDDEKQPEVCIRKQLPIVSPQPKPMVLEQPLPQVLPMPRPMLLSDTLPEVPDQPIPYQGLSNPSPLGHKTTWNFARLQ